MGTVIMADKLPLVVYVDGKRVVVGEAEVDGDYITADITDPDVAEKIARAQLDHLSIGGAMNTKRRNVFDQDKD